MDNNNMVETRTCEAGNFISDPEIMYNGILWGGGRGDCLLRHYIRVFKFL